MTVNKTVLISKAGTISTKKCRDLKQENLYKKCGFSKDNGFKKQHTYKINNYFIDIYGKTVGRSGDENKFDFPPPIDKTVFYGTMICIKNMNSNEFNPVNYTHEEWNKDYETLFGGFEDIETSENETELDETESIDEKFKTQSGYIKDGFVIDDDEKSNDDDEDEENIYIDSELEEEEYETCEDEM